MHLDLSGLIFGEKIVQIIEKIKESKTLIAVNLNDNNFSLALKN